MADVETLDPLDRLGQAQHVAKRIAARVLRIAAVEFGGQGQLRVAAGQFHIASALAAHIPLQLHLALGRGRQRGDQQIGIGNLPIQQDLARRLEFDVVLGDEGGQHFFRTLLAIGAGEERAGAEVAAIAERQQQHAGLRALHGHRQRPGRRRGRPRTGGSACCATRRSDPAGAQPARTPAPRWRPASARPAHVSARRSCLQGTVRRGAPIRHSPAPAPAPRRVRCNGRSGTAGTAANGCGTRCPRSCAA